MPKFRCTVMEDVSVSIDMGEIEAETKEEAAQIARDRWVDSGKGEITETVEDRWVDVDGDEVYPARNP